MKRTVFKAIAAIIVLTSPMAADAQRRVEGEVKADIVSHYMWRGQDRGGFTVLPAMSASWQGISLGVVGSTGFSSDDEKEIDVTLGFERWGFNIGVTDYWTADIDSENRSFYYDEKNGGHVFEGNLGYTCKYFSLQAYCMFYGNDFKIDGKHAYSTYAELTVPFSLGGVDWEVRAGATPFESSGHMITKTVYLPLLGNRETQVPEYDYADKFSCTEAALRATKDVRLGGFAIPVYAELNTNPYLKKAALLFGFTIKPF